jgi:glycosyltransferase involved in cell wall biosynthesis
MTVMSAERAAIAASWNRKSTVPADVCLIVEGCYPFVPGGVSGWIDWLMRTQPDRTFSVVSLWPQPNDVPPRYMMPDNAISFHPLYLQSFGAVPRQSRRIPQGLDDLARSLGSFLNGGGVQALVDVSASLTSLKPRVPLDVLFNSQVAWDLVSKMYQGGMPYGSFLHFFWAWRALLGGLFAALEFRLPQAKVYHTISTGYAGVLAARASLETGRPMLLTEHGIYTNERRIELLMADWVADTIDKGHSLDDPRTDLRDMWIHAFEAYARTCYEAATEVITLYEDNQRVQKSLGASAAASRVIANGIDVSRFVNLKNAADDARPTMALIGRVVPIKDVKCFIQATKLLRERVPNLRAIVMGPVDEDTSYVDECRIMARDLDLHGCLEFTGAVNITEYLPDVHVVVLTSLSESQPLTLLEAGAAGIPFVATHVGSCREIIEGRSDEQPPLGRGGFVTAVVAPHEIADAVETLLHDHEMRRSFGAVLRQRVNRYYRSEQAASQYRNLYETYCAAASISVPGKG